MGAERRVFRLAALVLVALAGRVDAQAVALGAGVLSTKDFGVGVAELYAASPAIHGIDVYGIGSWQKGEARPTVILALERPWVFPRQLVISPAVGVVMFPFEDYTPHPMINATVIALLPIERLSFNTVLATQPFDRFAWSIVTKLAITLVP